MTAISASQAALRLLERRIVEKGKAHRALDLEGTVAGEKDGGRVGVDALHLLAAVGRGIGEKRQHLRLGRVRRSWAESFTPRKPFAPDRGAADKVD